MTILIIGAALLVAVAAIASRVRAAAGPAPAANLGTMSDSWIAEYRSSHSGSHLSH